MKFIFLHDENGELYALNPEKVISVYDNKDPDMNAKTEILAGNGRYYAQQNMGDIVAALERNGK